MTTIITIQNLTLTFSVHLCLIKITYKQNPKKGLTKSIQQIN